MSSKFIQIQIISFLLLVANASKHSNESLKLFLQRSNECEDLSLDELENMFAAYLIDFRKFEEMILVREIEQASSDMDNFNTVNKYIRNQTQCNLQERKLTSINQASLCPWIYVTTRKNNRYPKIRSEVMCTCDKCTTISKKELRENMYACKPVLKSVPVLIRGECGSDGFYTYERSIDQVNVACVCSLKNAFKPVIKLRSN